MPKNAPDKGNQEGDKDPLSSSSGQPATSAANGQEKGKEADGTASVTQPSPGTGSEQQASPVPTQRRRTRRLADALYPRRGRRRGRK